MVIGEDANTFDRAAAAFHIPVSCPESLSPVLYVLPAQLLAHELSLLKGLDPEAPRGLSKVAETWCTPVYVRQPGPPTETPGYRHGRAKHFSPMRGLLAP